MDYRAAGAAAYLGLGATWAMGLSSSAAQLQANAASLPQSAAADHRRHSVLRDDLPVAVAWSITVVLLVVSVSDRRLVGAGTGDHAVTAEAHGHRRHADDDAIESPPPKQPGEWLEYSPGAHGAGRRSGGGLARAGVRAARAR